MRGAFVVQLREGTQSSELEDFVEEVDTGEQVRFHSERELIAFLSQRMEQTRQEHAEQGTNE
jgi:hypothetical protein